MQLEEFLNELCPVLVGVCIFISILCFIATLYLICKGSSTVIKTKILEDNSKTIDIVKQTIKETKK